MPQFPPLQNVLLGQHTRKHLESQRHCSETRHDPIRTREASEGPSPTPVSMQRQVFSFLTSCFKTPFSSLSPAPVIFEAGKPLWCCKGRREFSRSGVWCRRPTGSVQIRALPLTRAGGRFEPRVSPVKNGYNGSIYPNVEACHVPGTVLDTDCTAVRETDADPALKACRVKPARLPAKIKGNNSRT